MNFASITSTIAGLLLATMSYGAKITFTEAQTTSARNLQSEASALSELVAGENGSIGTQFAVLALKSNEVLIRTAKQIIYQSHSAGNAAHRPTRVEAMAIGSSKREIQHVFAEVMENAVSDTDLEDLPDAAYRALVAHVAAESNAKLFKVVDSDDDGGSCVSLVAFKPTGDHTARATIFSGCHSPE